MAKAKPILSSKRELEKQRQRHQATLFIARGKAKKAIQARIRSEGHRLIEYSCRELRDLTQAYFDANKAELLANAKHVIDTWSGRTSQNQ